MGDGVTFRYRSETCLADVQGTQMSNDTVIAVDDAVDDDWMIRNKSLNV